MNITPTGLPAFTNVKPISFDFSTQTYQPDNGLIPIPNAPYRANSYENVRMPRLNPFVKEREKIVTEHYTTLAENPEDGFSVDLTSVEVANLPIECQARFIRMEKLVGDMFSVRFTRDDTLPNEEAVKQQIAEAKQSIKEVK